MIKRPSKTLVFDLDGTLVDLYGVPNWEKMLCENNTLPYEIAKPIYDMSALNNIILQLKAKGWHIVITTWASKNADIDFYNRIREAKQAWLNEYHFPYDEFHILNYGILKSNATQHLAGIQILIDDEIQVRNNWHLGGTINANRNILPVLKNLLEWSDVI